MRAMNRPPSSRDMWWSEHQRTCGGSYTKIREPEGYGKRVRHRDVKGKVGDRGDSSSKGNTVGNRDIRELLGGKGESSKGKDAKNGRQSSKGKDAKNRDIGELLGESSKGKDAKNRDIGELGESSKGTKDSGELLGSRRKSPPVTVFPSGGFILGKGTSAVGQGNLREKILMAAEKREKESVCVLKRKKPRLEHVEHVDLTVDESKLHTDFKQEAPSIVILDASGSDIVSVKDDSRDNSSPDLAVVDSTSLPEEWFENLEDYKTCPVCGMGNIPSAIINSHVSLCLEADEQSRIVDD